MDTQTRLWRSHHDLKIFCVQYLFWMKKTCGQFCLPIPNPYLGFSKILVQKIPQPISVSFSAKFLNHVSCIGIGILIRSQPCISIGHISSVTRLYSNIQIFGTEYQIFKYEYLIFWLRINLIFVFGQVTKNEYIRYSYFAGLLETNIFDICIR